MATQAAASDSWTVSQVAEDLLAQMEDAQAAGWSEQEVVQTLEIQGLDATTATAMWADVRATAEAAGRLEALPDDAQAQGPFVDVTASARWIRTPGDPLHINEKRVGELAAALQLAGLLDSTANQFVNDLASHEQLILGVYRTRMRRLGKQGIIAGSLFTTFFVWSALVGGGTAYWHLATASATALLTGYSLLLYRNGSRPQIG